ncbi:MAG: type II toxin-antitoxin system death-on-curing family toxin [Phycisphaerales bacterium]|jgi:death-on-curing protein|nr:type II toxin-antitoxin system death-on-curing family toxin [Phycisphaerales bacterium]
MDVPFFTDDEVIAFHQTQISLHGGEPSVRDLGLLSSAVAMPMQMLNGEFVHTSIFEMAAAYLFHICNDHPFVDGNKCTAIMTALVFLKLNGIQCTLTENQVFELTIEVACGQLTKSDISKSFKNNHKRVINEN